LAGLQSNLEKLKELGASVIAASVDAEDKTRELAASLSLTYPLAWGVTRQTADTIGAWWESTRNFVQPAEFIVGADGKVVSSTYSSGPIGRVEPADIVSLIGFYEKRRTQGS
jgi:peroxiredoxin